MIEAFNKDHSYKYDEGKNYLSCFTGMILPEGFDSIDRFFAYNQNNIVHEVDKENGGNDVTFNVYDYNSYGYPISMESQSGSPNEHGEIELRYKSTSYFSYIYK